MICCINASIFISGSRIISVCSPSALKTYGRSMMVPKKNSHANLQLKPHPQTKKLRHRMTAQRTRVATIHQADHMHPVRTSLYKNVVQVIITQHACRGKVTRAQGFIVAVGFFSAVVISEFCSMSCIKNCRECLHKLRQYRRFQCLSTIRHNTLNE